jgi:hypothetical protein
VGACGAYLFNDCVATFCLNDPLVHALRVFVSGHQYESAWVFAHAFILLDAEHHGLEAAWIGAFAKEGHPIRGLEAMALRGALQPFVRSAESRLIRRELVGTPLLVEHQKRISAAEEFTLRRTT